MVVWSKNMKIKFEVELDTENEQDVDLVDELIEKLRELAEQIQ